MITSRHECVAARLRGQRWLGTRFRAIDARAAEFTLSQYHNQVAESPLHRHLVAMWDDIRDQTGGRVETRVYAQNNNIPGSDPQALGCS